MAVTKLSLYKDAITAIGGRRLATLTEERKSRRVLDDVWDDGRIVDECLETGPWAFAIRTARLEYDPEVGPLFGFKYGFEKPSDYIQTAAVCSDEMFSSPVIYYADEAGYWFSDLTEVYVKYVSNDAAYGLDMTKWPQSFKEYVAFTMAYKASFQITHSESREESCRVKMERARLRALGRDGLKKPTSFVPIGRFQSARGGQSSKRYDRA